MGTNRRYAEAVDRRMNEKALVTVARDTQLQSLTSLEPRLDELGPPSTRARARKSRLECGTNSCPCNIGTIRPVGIASADLAVGRQLGALQAV